MFTQKAVNVMHPRVFRDTWRLTNWEVASLLGISERTVVAYCASSGAVSKRNPSASVQRITFDTHQSLLNEYNEISQADTPT